MNKDEAWEGYRTALGRYAEAYVRAGEVVDDEVAARLRGAGSLLEEAVALIAAVCLAEALADPKVKRQTCPYCHLTREIPLDSAK